MRGWNHADAQDLGRVARGARHAAHRVRLVRGVRRRWRACCACRQSTTASCSCRTLAMVQVPKELEDAFFGGHRSARVPFVVNDSVDVLAGLHAGRRAAVISILAIEPELELCVELDDGSNAHLLAKPPSRFRTADGMATAYRPARRIEHSPPDGRAIRRYGPLHVLHPSIRGVRP